LAHYHLTEAAAHWETVSERSYSVAHGVWSDALTVDWSGEAAEALRTDTHADMMTTSAVVDQLQEAAKIARSGASDLEAARSQMRYAVEDTHSAGFEVGEEPAHHPETAEPPFPPPKQINGFTGHGRQSVNNHDGHGVNDDALHDAVEHPMWPPSYQIDEQGRAAYLYQGKDAIVVLI
jgi:hypothetical protein